MLAIKEPLCEAVFGAIISKIFCILFFVNREELLDCIALDANIRFGKPCIKGTRVTVKDILEWLSSGMSIPEILEDYPLLKEKHIYAALTFAAKREELTRIAVAV